MIHACAGKCYRRLCLTSTCCVVTMYLTIEGRQHSLPFEHVCIVAGIAETITICRWSPDTDISAHVVQAATASDIIDMLRSMDKHKVKHLLQNAAMVSSLFRYRHLSTDDEQHSSPTVPDAVIELMCSRVMESGSNTIESI